jgi:hypothetical protein
MGISNILDSDKKELAPYAEMALIAVLQGKEHVHGMEV